MITKLNEWKKQSLKLKKINENVMQNWYIKDGTYKVGKYGLGCDTKDEIINALEDEDNDHDHIFQYKVPEGSTVEIKKLEEYDLGTLIQVKVIKLGDGSTPFDMKTASETVIYYSEIYQAFGSGNIVFVNENNINEQVIPNGAAVKFMMNGLSEEDFDQEHLPKGKITELDSKVALVEGIYGPPANDKDLEYYDIEFGDGTIMYGVSGHHLDFEADDINESSLTKETLYRMEGLANIENLKTFNNLLSSLTEEWLNEGFDREDIMNYINDQIVLLNKTHNFKK